MLERFRLLSRDQLMTLAGFGSITRVNTRLALMVKTGLLRRKQMPVYPGGGSSQALYFLGPRSAEVLATDRRVLTSQMRHSARAELRQVEHTLAANQVIVEFVASLKDRGPTGTGMIAFRTELELRRIFSDRRPVPDAWVSWRCDELRFNAFCEIDLGSEGLMEWRQKVLSYLDYAESGLHRERFGFGSFRVLVLARSQARLANLRRVAESAGRLFLFGTLSAIGRQNLFEPVWLRAMGQELVALRDA